MSGTFADEYWNTACTEIEKLQKMGDWDLIDNTGDINVNNSTWQFKIKLFPNGLINKYKYRFCTREDQQLEGVDFFETYAPVMPCTKCFQTLVLVVLLEFKSKQGNVTAELLNADVEESDKKIPKGS